MHAEAQRCSRGESEQAAEGAKTLGGGDSCMRRRAEVSAVAVVNCEAHNKSGARSAETESFAVTRATIAERYQSEVRPNTRTAVGARCSARPHGSSSSSAAGQPAAVCRMWSAGASLHVVAGVRDRVRVARVAGPPFACVQRRFQISTPTGGYH